MAMKSRALKFVATACAAAACLLPIASAQLSGGPRGGGGLILHDGYGFTANAIEVDGPVSSMSDARFNDRASSIQVLGGRWEVCTDGRFRGRCEIITRDVRDLRSIGMDNKISSVRRAERGGGFGPGPNRPRGDRPDYGSGGITLFRDGNFRGDYRSFNSEIRSLGSVGFNDRASSIEVTSGRWYVCEHSDFRGRCEVIDRSFRSLSEIGLNDRISSLRPARRGDRSNGYGYGNNGYGHGGQRPRGGYGHGGGYGNDRGYDGQDTVFFPRPTDRYGQRIQNGSGQATRFCRDMGFRGAEYKGNGRYLKDVLCEK